MRQTTPPSSGPDACSPTRIFRKRKYYQAILKALDAKYSYLEMNLAILASQGRWETAASILNKLPELTTLTINGILGGYQWTIKRDK